MIVPGAAALAMALSTTILDKVFSFENVWRYFRLYALFGAYPSALMIAVPAYLSLRNLLSQTLLNCVVVGSLSATLPWLALLLLPNPDQASIGGQATVIDGVRTAYGWQKTSIFLGGVALFGAFGGSLFWLIAAAGHSSSTAEYRT